MKNINPLAEMAGCAADDLSQLVNILDPEHDEYATEDLDDVLDGVFCNVTNYLARLPKASNIESFDLLIESLYMMSESPAVNEKVVTAALNAVLAVARQMRNYK